MTDWLDLTKKAVAEWRRNHGNESLYTKCQRFSGWYMNWAWQGFKNSGSILTYNTAQLAANASKIVSKNINDTSAKAGWNYYWTIPTGKFKGYGHVAHLLGFDGSRAVVAHTGANGADEILNLGNGVIVSHADTIDYPFIGISKTDGKNKERTGISAHNFGKVNKMTKTFKVVKTAKGYLNGRDLPSTEVGDIVQTVKSGVSATFDGYVIAEMAFVNERKSDVWVRGAFKKNWFNAAGLEGFTTSGLEYLGKFTNP